MVPIVCLDGCFLVRWIMFWDIPGQHSHWGSHRETRNSNIQLLGWISNSGLPIEILSERKNVAGLPSPLRDPLQSNTYQIWIFVVPVWKPCWTPTLIQIENVNFLPLSTPSRTTGRRNAKSTWWLMTVGRLYWLYWLGILNGNSWLTGENGDYEDPWIPRVTLQHCHDDPFNWDKGGSGFLIWTQYEDDYKTRYTQNSLSPRGFNWLLLFKSLQHDLLVYLININTISVESMSSIFVWSSVVIFCPTEVKLKVFVVVLVLMSSSSSWETLQTGPSMVQWLFTEPGGWRGERAGCLQ